MKTVIIFGRQIKERTGYRSHPFKEVYQFIVFHGDKEIKNNHEKVNNSRLRVPFARLLETRRRGDLEAFAAKLGRHDGEKWLKTKIAEMLEGVE